MGGWGSPRTPQPRAVTGGEVLAPKAPPDGRWGDMRRDRSAGRTISGAKASASSRRGLRPRRSPPCDRQPMVAQDSPPNDMNGGGGPGTGGERPLLAAREN